jgi:hypothetical protein
MKTRTLWVALALLALMFIAGSCGKGKSVTVSQPQAGTQEDVQQNTATLPSGLTAEDNRVIAMSPEDRWDYLFAKFKRMVYEKYGIEIDYEPYPGKGTSGFGDDGTDGSNHQVQELAYHKHSIGIEDIASA